MIATTSEAYATGIDAHLEADSAGFKYSIYDKIQANYRQGTRINGGIGEDAVCQSLDFRNVTIYLQIRILNGEPIEEFEACYGGRYLN